MISPDSFNYYPILISYLLREDHFHIIIENLSSDPLNGWFTISHYADAIIHIRHRPENDRLSATSLTSCIAHWYPPTEKCFMETVHDWQN
uniref:Uncharacterized protein n=1 Tax=Onchocerca volvulus TaxID=6282 RepID=A0A8R1U378_ONCVO